MARFVLDPRDAPRLSADEKARLDAMTDEEITAAALSDPDNPPLTEDELDRVRAIQLIRSIRAAAGLSQSGFAAAFRIEPGRLQDMEQGRARPDSAMLAYLTVIAHEPDAVRRALEAADGPAKVLAYG